MAANLTGGLLRRLAAALPEPAPRALLASGIRPEEAAGVEQALAARGLAIAERVEEGGWLTLLLRR